MEASFSLRMRLSCARRNLSSASRSSALRCSRASVRRRTSRSKSTLIDSVERSRSRSERRISSKITARRPSSSASPQGGTGRASCPLDISPERSSKARSGTTTSRTANSARPAASTMPMPNAKRAAPPGGACSKSQRNPTPRTQTPTKDTVSFKRSPTGELTWSGGSAWRDPKWRTSGRRISCNAIRW